MPSAAECRQNAAECLRLAKESKTDSDRDTLLKMAEEWAYAATLSAPAKPPLPPSDSEAFAGPANAKSPSHVAQQQQQPQPDPEKEEE
jgi:hypothetical protein